MRKNSGDTKGSRPQLEGRSDTIGVGVLLALLAVFVLVVVLVSFSVRGDIRGQLLSVDSHVLNKLVQNQITKAENEIGLIYPFETLDEIEIWSALLETATLDGVFAVQYFDVDGTLRQSSSKSLIGYKLDSELRSRLEDGRSFTAFREQLWLSELLTTGLEQDRKVDVLDIYLHLKDGSGSSSLGAARYLMDGSVLAAEFRVLDARLARQAVSAVGIGGAVMAALFWLAWKRLGEANVRERRQAARLRRANSELAALARTSAVGSVTAHLIHGLKNPLAGLRQVVSAQKSGTLQVGEEEWRGLGEAADRMQRMVEEVIAVLQDASTGISYEMTSGELLEELRGRFAVEAVQRTIKYSVDGDKKENLDSNICNIVSLIAGNLIKNAFESSPVGGAVSLRFQCDQADRSYSLRVEDDGPGVPEEMRERLFVPTDSSKSGGAGIGLAISSQLARHLGGELCYVDEAGCGAVFVLRFPFRSEGEAFGC